MPNEDTLDEVRAEEEALVEQAKEIVEEAESTEGGEPEQLQVDEPRGLRANSIIADEAAEVPDLSNHGEETPGYKFPIDEDFTEETTMVGHSDMWTAEKAEVAEEERLKEIASELDALKTEMTKEPEVQAEKKTVHDLHDEEGMAGSRNAFPAKNDKVDNRDVERKGQRTGMFIGAPTRHNRKHLKTKKKDIGGRGAQKIDDDRPINN